MSWWRLENVTSALTAVWALAVPFLTVIPLVLLGGVCRPQGPSPESTRKASDAGT